MTGYYLAIRIVAIMTEKFIKITKTSVENLPYTTSGQLIYRDIQTKGFGVLVGKRTKSYFVERKVSSKTRRVMVGRHGEISTEQARREAEALRGVMGQGRDPVEEKKQEKANTVTLNEVFLEFLHIRKALKPNTIRSYEHTMAMYFKDWLNKPIVTITKDMVSRLHIKIGNKHGEAQANLAMRILRAVVNFAAGNYEDSTGKPIITENPVRRLSQTRAWYRVERRQSLIKTHELPALFDALDKLDMGLSTSKAEVVKDYILLLLFTGLRRQEAATLKWDDIDFKDKTFTIRDTKNREPLTLPLSDFLFDLLKKRYEKRTNEYVFPGVGKTGHLVEPKRQLVKIKELSGLQFMLHDLRRTFITIAESLNIPSYAVKRLANHKMSGDVTAGYIIFDADRLRKPMQQITDHILKCAKKKQEADVIDLDSMK